MNKNDILLDEIVRLMEPYTEFVFLLGSYGTDRYLAESDIDLACYYTEQLSEKEKTLLWNNLELLTDRSIDLVELNQVDSIFARQVIETGRLLFNRNPELLLKWKITNNSKYIDFKMDRHIIEENILIRKKLI